jgi:hypothetical protein
MANALCGSFLGKGIFKDRVVKLFILENLDVQIAKIRE